MKPNLPCILLILLLSSALLAACSSRPNSPPGTTEAPQAAEELPTAVPAETAEPQVDKTTPPPAENVNFEISEGETTLLVYAGEVRVSPDDGESWSLADTGLWLKTGDRLQVSPGGLALILFPDGSLIRLEGFTDFKLVQAEFDFESGTKRVIGRILDGAALATTLPLPNAQSYFQLWAMTSLIDLPYDPEHAIALDQGETVPEENRIAFGAAQREDLDGEFLFSYADSVLPDYYALEMVFGEVVLIKTRPRVDQLTQYFIPFRNSLEDEFELEGLLDMAAGVISESRETEDVSQVDFYGYTMIEEGSLSEDQTLYSVFPVYELDEFLAEAGDPAEQAEFVRYVSSSPAYKRHELHYRYFKKIPDIFAPEILLMLDKYNMGCDIDTGLGCAIPESCNQETGEGCTFTSGCNIITREGCKRAYLSCIAYTNCDWMPCGRRPVVEHFCKPRVRTYCDPDLPGDCDQYLLTASEQLVLLAEQMGPTSESTKETSAAEEGTSPEAASSPAEETGFETMGALPLALVQNADLAGQPLYDPNQPASLEDFYNADAWEQLLQYYQELYGDDDDDWEDGEEEWCTCTAKVPPGYPPPPPWMDMTYRCWCSDPGAHR